MGKWSRVFLVFALLFSIAGYAEAATNYWFSPLTAKTTGSSLDIDTFEPFPDTAIRVFSVRTTAELDSEWLIIGLTVPSGASGKIKQLEICYEVETDSAGPTSTYISETRLTETTTPGATKIIHDDDTDLKSTVPTCYKSRTKIKKVNGTITLELRMVFGNTADSIRIGGIRLRVSK